MWAQSAFNRRRTIALPTRGRTNVLACAATTVAPYPKECMRVTLQHLGLALVIAVYRHYRTTDVDQLDQLKG